jgi:hypothetical protein
VVQSLVNMVGRCLFASSSSKTCAQTARQSRSDRHVGKVAQERLQVMKQVGRECSSSMSKALLLVLPPLWMPYALYDTVVERRRRETMGRRRDDDLALATINNMIQQGIGNNMMCHMSPPARKLG